MDFIRSFIAIELPQRVTQGLARLQERLLQFTPKGVKWVDPAGIHLTIKFLGEVPSNQIRLISANLAEIVKGIKAFSLGVEGLGVFPDSRRPRVVWVAVVREVDKLVQLQQAVDSALAPLGFKKENRPFVPHLTLARLRDDMPYQERQSFGQHYLAARLETIPFFKVESLDLMKSQLTPRGAIYTRLDTFGFSLL